MSSQARQLGLISRWMWTIIPLMGATAAATAAELQVLLPLGRTAYQTNEWIDVSVVRQAPQPLAAGDLVLRLAGDDGSRLTFTFAVPAAGLVGPEARRTEHLHLSGWLLRPGRYRIEVAADGATTASEFEVYSHVRKTSFRLVNWGRAQGPQQLVEGEDSLGFNMFYGGYGNDDQANFIRAGMDFMSCCTMGGAHQMDMRTECDWSDPYVIRGGTQRVARRAFIDRTRPNVPGVHFYDEPGLTLFKHPVTGEMTPHGIPSQVRSFRAAFGKDPLPYYEVKPDNPDHVAQWRQWALWKLGLMDAAWKEAQFGVSYVRPDFLSVTQSQYGWSAFTDGYYFNVARCLPVASGHGGYDDFGCGYFNPSYFLEMARARDLAKPCWYLPTWYGNTPSERFRLEQNLSFMMNIQGMLSPPDIDPFDPAKKPAADGVVESNKLMARLGTIFTTMPVTRPPVAMLYSMSHNIHEQTGDRKSNYAHDNKQGRHLPFTYMAGKLLQQQFMAVVEEDIVDGTLAALHKAVILTSIDFLDPPVVAALEAFAAGGGLVLQTGDCRVKIQGAVNLGVVPELPDAAIVNKLRAAGKYAEANKYSTVGHLIAGATPLAKAIKAQLDKAGIRPIFECDQPGIVATRQAAGDIEYLFAVNATYDPASGGMNDIKAIEATITLVDDGRPVYDAVRGGPVPEFQKKGGKLTGRFRFGPGQMRVFARPECDIKVETAGPVLRRDYTAAEQPLSVEIAATVTRDSGGLFTGAVPLSVRLLDRLGIVRYDVYRATDQHGVLRLRLPLAANDPPGVWVLAVSNLLNNWDCILDFKVPPTPQCGAMAGATQRAVSFGPDRDNVFRFFRVHHDVTLVVGKSDYNQPAAERLSQILRPWGVRCKIVKAAEVNRPRELSAEEAATWVGLEPGRCKPGKENPVSLVGFDIQGPVVLLGTPEDNPLIQFIQKQRFLPYQPDPIKFPGRARGMFAWQRDAVGAGQESICLIAYDAAGMGEAVGTLYEAVAGLEPLTRFEPPRASSVAPATSAATKDLGIAWQLLLPDRAVAMKADRGQIQVLTWDGSLHRVDAAGKIIAQQAVPPADMAKTVQQLQSAPDAAGMELARKHAPVNRIVKAVAVGKDAVAVAYWGGTLQVLSPAGELHTSQLLPQDIAGLVWLDGKLVVGLADGQLVALQAK